MSDSTATHALLMLSGLLGAHLPAFLVAAIPGLINLGLSAYVFFNMPRRLLTTIFALMLFTSACWEFSVALMSISPGSQTAFLVDNLLAPFGMLTAPLILHFTFLFVGIKIRTLQRVTINLAYFITAFISVAYPTLNSIENYVHDPFWGWLNTRQSGGVYGAVTGIVLQIQYFLGIGILIRGLLRSRRGSVQFSQILLILIPYCIIIVQALITEAILPQVLKINPIPLSSPSSALFSIATFIAVKKFKLFGDIRSIPREELLSALTDIVIVADPKLNIGYVNKTGLDLLKCTLPEMEGRPLSDFLDQESMPGGTTMEELMRAVLAGKRVHDTHCVMVSGEKEPIPVEVRADALVSKGETEGILIVCRNISELEQVQRESERNSRRFQKIIEKSKDAVTISSEQGIVQYAGPTVFKVIGYEPAELEGTHFINYVHPDSIEDALNAFKESMDVSRAVEERTIKCIHKNGQTIWLEVSLLNLLNDDDVQGFVAVFRDVTEKRRNELEREKSFALFESIIHNMGHAVLVEDENRRLTTVNEKFCEFFSIPMQPLSMIGADCAQAAEGAKHLVKDPNRFISRINELIESGKPVMNEIVEFADGRICERDYIPVKTFTGRFLGHLWRYVDVTSKVQTRKELVEKNRVLALTQEIGHMGSWIAEMGENARAWWSDETLAIYEISREEFDSSNATYFDYIHPDDKELMYRISGQGIAEKKPFDLEHRIILKDGRIKWVYNRVIAEYDVDKPLRLLGITQDITKRKLLEQDLVEKNQFLAFTQEIGQIGTWTANMVTGEAWWSRQSLEIYGLTEEEFDGRGDTYFKFVHPDDLASVQSAGGQAMAEKKPWTVEHRIVLRDGTVKWIYGRIAGEYEGDNLVRLVGINMDITWRKQLEQELREKNRSLELTLEIGQMGAWWSDLKSGKDEFHLSKEALSIYELTEEEAERNPLRTYDLIHPEDLPEVNRLSAEALKEHKPYIVEHRILMKDGRIKWVYNRAYAEYEGDRAIRLTGIVQDITRRKELERELVDQNRFLEMTLEIGQMGSWRANIEPGNGKAWWSKESMEIFELNEEEFVGLTKTYFEFVHPDDLERVNRVIEQGVAERKYFSAEHRIVLKNGSVKWVYFRAFPEYRGDTPVQITGVIQDITSRKTAEEEIIAQNEELRKINTELDKFVYSASHDIRSPLTSILGLINIASDEVDDPGAGPYFEMIRDRVHKLDEFTLDIIHYARNARTDVDVEIIPVKSLIFEVVESLKYQEMAQHVNFEIDVDPELLFTSDRGRITVVLSNIVSNAIKFQRKDMIPFVNIRAERQGETIEFCVEDNGEGIPPEKTGKVFDMFARFSQQSTGSGLGLYITKEIVDKLGGTIEVKSSTGKGSVFKVRLPEQSLPAERINGVHVNGKKTKKSSAD